MTALLTPEEATLSVETADLGVRLQPDEVAGLLWRAATVGTEPSILDDYEFTNGADPDPHGGCSSCSGGSCGGGSVCAGCDSPHSSGCSGAARPAVR